MSLTPTSAPTRIDIHPEPRAKDGSYAPMRSKQIQKETVQYEGNIEFADILDFINPLQHIPIVGNIYRAITGDEISTGARMAGGALFGGVIGFVAAGITEIFEEGTGKTVETHIAELLSGEDQNQPAKQQFAAAAATPNHTTSSQVARQALATPAAFVPQPPAPPQLDALDVSDIEAAKPTPLPAPTGADEGKHDAILDLFSQKMSDVSDIYKRSQMLSYTSQIARDMRA